MHTCWKTQRDNTNWLFCVAAAIVANAKDEKTIKDIKELLQRIVVFLAEHNLTELGLQGIVTINFSGYNFGESFTIY